MHQKCLFRHIWMLVLTAFLVACTQGNSGDEDTSSAGIPTGIERFLLFPNPVELNGGSFETNTTAYAAAYYRAIDPNNDRETLAEFKAANGFGSGTGTEHLAVFRDVRDLGYGRRMTGRRNTDGTVAFFVENYHVSTAPGGYSTVNVEAAVVRDTQWHIGTNAIEWSETPCIAGYDPVDCDNTKRIAKFYNFSSTTGQRQLAVDLDGKGLKAMPGPCITCHGGRGDPLTPVEVSTSQPRFPLVENSLSRKRGDVQARLQAFKVDSFEWSTVSGWSRADQEAKLKDFNQWVWCTFPGGASVTGTWGTCTQPVAGTHEWQGAAGEMIEDWYGGATMPNASLSDSYVPAGWAGNTSLYQEVVEPYCRTCHIVRGTAHESNVDFHTEAKFQSFADRIKVHVFDRGNMPLALLVYQDFWHSSAPSALAAFIDGQLGAGTVTTASGALKEPGRPVADPGPAVRMVPAGTNAPLSASNSLFASSYSWTQISGPVSATITNANSSLATFFSNTPGVYTIRLTVGNGVQSDSQDIDVTVDASFPDPANIKFAHVKNVMRNLSTCSTCHTPGSNPLPPIYYSDEDRDDSGGATDATDEAWFQKVVEGRVNRTEVRASPLLRKPSGNHHSGGNPLDLTTTNGLSYFSMVYYWILNGTPGGGVIANAGANSTETLTFSGSPLQASVPLDGSGSIDAATYSWSIVSQPAGGNASFSNATVVSPTLTVENVGVYVVQLQASNGGDIDTAQRQITVNETAIAAAFTPPTGSTAVSFSGLPAMGTITLTSTSTGSPTNCRWQVTAPGGVTGSLLDGSSTLDVTKSCGSNATLTVPDTAVGAGTYQIQLTASNIGSNATTHFVSVTSGTPVTFSIAPSNFTNKTFTGGNTGTWTPGSATVNLTSNVTSAVLPVTYSWQILSQPSTANISGGAASFSSATAASPTLTVHATGAYQVRLTVTDNVGTVAQQTSNFTVTPSGGFTFDDVKTLISSTLSCTGCHTGADPDPSSGSGTPPDWNDVLTNTNTKNLWERFFQRTNLGTPTSSRLLACPNAGCDTMGSQASFSATTAGSNYDNVRKWIAAGAPPGN